MVNLDLISVKTESSSLFSKNKILTQKWRLPFFATLKYAYGSNFRFHLAARIFVWLVEVSRWCHELRRVSLIKFSLVIPQKYTQLKYRGLYFHGAIWMTFLKYYDDLTKVTTTNKLLCLHLDFYTQNTRNARGPAHVTLLLFMSKPVCTEQSIGNREAIT